MATKHIQPRRAQYKEIPTLNISQQEAFWAKIDRRGPEECWPWKGGVTRNKYGGGVYGIWKGLRPHRVAYTLVRGPIPDGLTLDHVKERCSLGGLCCNPFHTEPVTQSVNSRRYYAHKPKVCKQRGHPKPYPGTCKECVRISLKEWRARNRERVNAIKRRHYAKQRDHTETIPTVEPIPNQDGAPRPEVRR